MLPILQISKLNGAGNARTDFYLDGSAIITLKNQMVGIGDTSPSYALDVNGTGRYYYRSYSWRKPNSR